MVVVVCECDRSPSITPRPEARRLSVSVSVSPHAAEFESVERGVAASAFTLGCRPPPRGATATSANRQRIVYGPALACNIYSAPTAVTAVT